MRSGTQEIFKELSGTNAFIKMKFDIKSRLFPLSCNFTKSFFFCQDFFRYCIITFDFFFIVSAIESISLKPLIVALLVPVITDEMKLVFFHRPYYTFGKLKIKEYFQQVLKQDTNIFFKCNRILYRLPVTAVVEKQICFFGFFVHILNVRDKLF